MKAYNKYEVDEIFSSWQSDLDRLDVIEVYTKSDIVAMLTEIQLEIEEMSGLVTEIHGKEWNEVNVIHSQDILSFIQQKINALKGKENVDKA